MRGRTALVTGAGRGIGRSIALAFARESARVTLMARSRDELERVRAECEALGAEAIVAAGDVTSLADVDAAVFAAGSVDVLVHAAGAYGPIGATSSVDVDAWRRAVDVNLCGTFLVCRAVAGGMLARGSGSIALLGGGGATGPLPRFSAYAASKAAVARLAETLAEELRPTVQVNVIAPGLVDTSLQNDVLAAGEEAGPLYEKVLAARRSGAGAVSPELAAELAVFLASPDSGGLTGKLISAPHDPWRAWGDRAEELNKTALFTIRRIDPFTVRPLAAELL